MKKLVVNGDACISCGACVSIDPDHFDFNENMVSHAISQENLEAESVQTAIDSCPTSAISLTDEDDNENCACEHCEHCEHEEGEE